MTANLLKRFNRQPTKIRYGIVCLAAWVVVAPIGVSLYDINLFVFAVWWAVVSIIGVWIADHLQREPL